MANGVMWYAGCVCVVCVLCVGVGVYAIAIQCMHLCVFTHCVCVIHVYEV